MQALCETCLVIIISLDFRETEEMSIYGRFVMFWTVLGHLNPCSLDYGRESIVSKMKLTLLGSVMAFGLAPQVVAQDSTVIFADADSYEVVLDKPLTLELDEANFKSLRDLGINVGAESTHAKGQPFGRRSVLGVAIASACYGGVQYDGSSHYGLTVNC